MNGANLGVSLIALQSRVVRLETTLLALLKTVAEAEGLPKGFKETLIRDSQDYLTAMTNEQFRQSYGPEAERWNNLFAALREKS